LLRPVCFSRREFCTPTKARNIPEELSKIVKQDKVVVFMKVRNFQLSSTHEDRNFLFEFSTIVKQEFVKDGRIDLQAMGIKKSAFPC
jgi:hypothetical protein